MLCDDCINVIMRTTQNGTQDPVTARVCSLDGAHMTYQLKECSRKEEKVVPVVEKVVEAVLPPLKEVSNSKRWKRGT